MQRNCIEQGGSIQGERVDREQLQHGYRDGHDREPETQIEGDTAVGRSVFVSIEHAQADRERHQNHRRDQYLARPRLDPESLSHMTIRP